MVIRVRLADKRSGEFRRANVAAASRDEAVAIVEAQEAGHVAWQLDADDALRLEQKLRTGELSGRERARLLSHRQERPYKVMKVEG